MAVSVRTITLWRGVVENRPGALAEVLEPVSAAAIPAILVNGPNRAGLAHRVARALADEGINIAFLVAQVVGRSYSAVFGFESDADANSAVALVRKAVR